MASPATQALVHFAARLRFEDLPPEVVRLSKRCVLDTLGVAIGGVESEAARIALAVARELGGRRQARVLGFGTRTSVALAALVNGVLSHVLDFDDTHLPTILHPSGPLLAAALPLAEWRRASGCNLIVAYVVGYEVAARASRALYPEHYDVGWHMTGTTGTLGAAAASARLLGLDEAQVGHALGLAATQAAGHREQFGAMAKSLHAGKAASNGVLAALLAQRGYTAADDSLEGRRGMFRVMSARFDPEPLRAALGERWEIFQTGVKPYACGVVLHPALDAVLRLRERYRPRPDEVERIELRVHPLVLELTGKPEPRTGLEGKFSVRFAAAIALLDGAARQRQFSDAAVRRPEVAALRDRVVATADSALSPTAAEATLRLRDGRALVERVVTASGTPENPLSDAALREKFLDLVEPALGTEGGERLAELVERLEHLPDVGELVAAAVPSRSGRSPRRARTVARR